MLLRATLAVAVLAVMAGCQATASPSPAVPSPSAASPVATAPHGVEGLADALDATGSDAKKGAAFASEPIGGQGSTVCVGAETVQTYEFIDHEAALAASLKIDRDDPSHIGNALIEWAGVPRFWLRDRIIVLYLGEDAPTDSALRSVLGQPFAEGEPGRMRLPEPPCQ